MYTSSSLDTDTHIKKENTEITGSMLKEAIKNIKKRSKSSLIIMLNNNFLEHASSAVTILLYDQYTKGGVCGVVVGGWVGLTGNHMQY